MREQILTFLREIDEHLVEYAQPGESLDLYLIGRSSLILRLDLALTTDDIDIVRMSTPAGAQNLEERAIELFGEGTTNALRLGLHLERVAQGLPPVPQRFRRRCEDIPGQWQVIRPKLLEYHDFAATKLKRFSAKDRQDLKILCDKNLITQTGLREALDSAFAFSASEDDDPDRKSAYESLRKVCAYLETGEASF